MRKSFDALAQYAKTIVSEDIFAGHLFVFVSKPGNKMKVLYWDSDGFAMWYKRLEEGSFKLPKPLNPEDILSISSKEFSLILNGIKLSKCLQNKRYTKINS